LTHLASGLRAEAMSGHPHLAVVDARTGRGCAFLCGPTKTCQGHGQGGRRTCLPCGPVVGNRTPTPNSGIWTSKRVGPRCGCAWMASHAAMAPLDPTCRRIFRWFNDTYMATKAVRSLEGETVIRRIPLRQLKGNARLPNRDANGPNAVSAAITVLARSRPGRRLTGPSFQSLSRKPRAKARRYVTLPGTEACWAAIVGRQRLIIRPFC
jgi:hypothetical protein